jgi:acyl carrier protein
MDKQFFIKELQETLELEGKMDETTQIHLTSLSTLAIIAFVDENFEKRVKVADLKNINTVADLMKLIGIENFS